jgi:hypothetical protein
MQKYVKQLILSISIILIYLSWVAARADWLYASDITVKENSGIASKL